MIFVSNRVYIFITTNLPNGCFLAGCGQGTEGALGPRCRRAGDALSGPHMGAVTSSLPLGSVWLLWLLGSLSSPAACVLCLLKDIYKQSVIHSLGLHFT